MCHGHGSDEDKLEIEVCWEDALLKSAEVREGHGAIAEACHDECLELSFTADCVVL